MGTDANNEAQLSPPNTTDTIHPQRHRRRRFHNKANSFFDRIVGVSAGYRKAGMLRIKHGTVVLFSALNCCNYNDKSSMWEFHRIIKIYDTTSLSFQRPYLGGCQFISAKRHRIFGAFQNLGQKYS